MGLFPLLFGLMDFFLCLVLMKTLSAEPEDWYFALGESVSVIEV